MRWNADNKAGEWKQIKIQKVPSVEGYKNAFWFTEQQLLPNTHFAARITIDSFEAKWDGFYPFNAQRLALPKKYPSSTTGYLLTFKKCECNLCKDFNYIFDELFMQKLQSIKTPSQK